MAKRKLTRQQKWRIEKIQQDRIDRANKKSQTIENSFDQNYQSDNSQQHHGRIIKNYGQSLDVEDINSLKVYRCSFRQNLGAIVAGDEVVWLSLKTNTKNTSGKELQYDGVISGVKERRSLLSRPDGYGNKKTIAANIDQILIINAPSTIACTSAPRLNTGLIDRYLIAAESYQIQAVIAINKIDLLSEPELLEIKEKLQVYKKLGYKIVFSSTQKKPFLNEFTSLLSSKNSIFVGQSGVGKSSLLNCLLPEAQAKTAAVSAVTAKGRHTTSAAQLYHLEQAGIKDATLIDSPGIREFGLWDISEADVHNGFKEIKEFSKSCRFRDCKHENEPNCAILEAIEAQNISPLRYQSYQKIINSL
ncbi:MAG: small ribosomal subunit biogenesis GTPase RsgA [Pseudomonadota bacterium]